MRGLFLAMLALSWRVHAQDPALLRIRQALVPLRGQTTDLDTRGARPELTAIKHQLRDWVESRLHSYELDENEHVFEQRLNDEIQQAKLRCRFDAILPEERCHGTGADLSYLGFLNEVRLEKQSLYLVVITSVGILCGDDQSAYLYEWQKDHWDRRWQSEQTNYAKKQYHPQTVDSVQVSPESRGESRHLVFTLGHEFWCTSNWHPVYYRLWRIGDAQPKLLLDGSEMAFLGGPIRGRLATDDVLLQYSVSGYQVARGVVRHYVVGKDDSVKRVDPVALSPNGFVQEWQARPWAESAAWADPSVREVLKQKHQALRDASPFPYGGYPTLHCAGSPDLWQVGSGDPYFLVRWRPPYRFTMVRVSETPSPNCTEKDPEAEASRPLFLP